MRQFDFQICYPPLGGQASFRKSQSLIVVSQRMGAENRSLRKLVPLLEFTQNVPHVITTGRRTSEHDISNQQQICQALHLGCLLKGLDGNKSIEWWRRSGAHAQITRPVREN